MSAGFEVESARVRLRVRRCLWDELGVVEVGVEAAGGDELVVGSLFADVAGFDDEDLVGFADGGEAVGDDE
ncbi:hypothetical protein ACIQWV_29750 [Streptomyces sp. NPDC098085]|uniref:hypothetical protein n=1 Tax=unclassified Streptomyces TaxID=2593676 RepID=UPI003813355D